MCRVQGGGQGCLQGNAQCRQARISQEIMLQGDSGGPLSVAEGEGASTIWSLGGIISWGPYSCGEKYRPGVYTRVANFAQWIKENIRVHKYEWSKYGQL